MLCVCVCVCAVMVFLEKEDTDAFSPSICLCGYVLERKEKVWIHGSSCGIERVKLEYNKAIGGKKESTDTWSRIIHNQVVRAWLSLTHPDTRCRSSADPPPSLPHLHRKKTHTHTYKPQEILSLHLCLIWAMTYSMSHPSKTLQHPLAQVETPL